MFFIVRNQHTRKKMKNNILYKALWATTVNFRIYTSTNAYKAVKGQQKRTTQKNDARNKTERKRLGIYKRNKTQNMPTSEELWGDSPSGLAANAPFRSDSKVDLFIRVLANCLAGA